MKTPACTLAESIPAECTPTENTPAESTREDTSMHSYRDHSCREHSCSIHSCGEHACSDAGANEEPTRRDSFSLVEEGRGRRHPCCMGDSMELEKTATLHGRRSGSREDTNALWEALWEVLWISGRPRCFIRDSMARMQVSWASPIGNESPSVLEPSCQASGSRPRAWAT